MASVRIGDRDVEMRYSLGAVRKMERVGGVRLTDEGFDAWSRTTDGLSVLLWVGQLHDNPSLTQDESDEAIELRDIPRLMEAVRSAMLADLPVEAGTSEDHPNGSTEPVPTAGAPAPIRRSTGTNSGR